MSVESDGALLFQGSADKLNGDSFFRRRSIKIVRYCWENVCSSRLRRGELKFSELKSWNVRVWNLTWCLSAQARRI